MSGFRALNLSGFGTLPQRVELPNEHHFGRLWGSVRCCSKPTSVQKLWSTLVPYDTLQKRKRDSFRSLVVVLQLFHTGSNRHHSTSCKPSHNVSPLAVTTPQLVVHLLTLVPSCHTLPAVAGHA